MVGDKNFGITLKFLENIEYPSVSQDMIDFAARMLAGRYEDDKQKLAIVRAKLVVPEVILTVDFYLAKELCRGLPRPCYRIFLSCNNYWTIDLSDEKPKWKTRKLANIEKLGWIDSWISGRPMYYFFDKQEELVSRRFLAWYGGETVVNMIDNFQAKVAERKRTEKETALRERILKMSCYIEPVPAKVIAWIKKDVVSWFIKAPYTRLKDGKVRVACKSCGHEQILDNGENVSWYNKYVCPVCSTKATLCPSGRLKRYEHTKTTITYVQPYSKGCIIRVILVTAVQHAKDKTVGITCNDLMRTYCMRGDNGTVEVTDCSNNLYRCSKNGWFFGHWYDSANTLYMDNLSEVLLNMGVVPIVFEFLKRMIPRDVSWRDTLVQCVTMPELESIVKMNMTALAKDILFEKNQVIVGHNSKLHRSLGISLKSLRVLRTINGDSSVLEILRVFDKAGAYVGMNDILQFCRLNGASKFVAEEVCRYGFATKVIRYLSREYKANESGVGYNFINEWYEYIRWCKELKLDLNKQSICIPGNFSKAHYSTYKQVLKDREDRDFALRRSREQSICALAEYVISKLSEVFECVGENVFRIDSSGLVLVVPMDIDSINYEGKVLNHCVGTYIPKVANVETCIFFIRDESEIGRPYYTMEFKGNVVTQCRGLWNRDYRGNPVIASFVETFERRVDGKLVDSEMQKYVNEYKRSIAA